MKEYEKIPDFQKGFLNGIWQAREYIYPFARDEFEGKLGGWITSQELDDAFCLLLRNWQEILEGRGENLAISEDGKIGWKAKGKEP